MSNYCNQGFNAGISFCLFASWSHKFSLVSGCCMLNLLPLCVERNLVECSTSASDGHLPDLQAAGKRASTM